MPQRVIGKRRIKDNLLVADGVLKLDVAGKKGNAAIGIAATRTVFQIALDGMAKGR